MRDSFQQALIFHIRKISMRPLWLLLLCILSVTGRAFGDTLVITVTTTASGSVFSNTGSILSSFSDAPVVFTYTGDTGNTSSGPGYASNSSGIETTSVAGFGTYTDSGTWSGRITGNGPGFGFGGLNRNGIRPDGGGGVFVSVMGDAFNSYDLMSSFGPYTGSSYFQPRGYAYSFVVNGPQGGYFSFAQSDIAPTATFQATISTAPEPSSLLLMATGIAGMLTTARRRFTGRTQSSQV